MMKPLFKLFYATLLLMLSCSALVPSEKTQPFHVHFCPKEDCGKIIEEELLHAKDSIRCAFYDIDLKNIISALSSKSKDIDVKIVTDESTYKGQIKGEGYRLDNHRQLMHNKFCVIDSSIVIMGSMNPTVNDNTMNSNNIMIFHSKYLAKNYEAEFEELWAGNFGKGEKNINTRMILNEIEIENYFCPEDCSLELSSSFSKDSGLYKIIDLISKSETSIQVAAFTFTHEKIADELVKADARGVNVSIIVETRQQNVMGSQYQRLRDLGLNIELDGNKYTMHHKFIVIDGKIVITGSVNPTLAGFNKNDENFLIIYDEEIALRYILEFNSL